MSEVADTIAANPPISDKEAIRYINKRLREEGIRVKERYIAGDDLDELRVTTETRRSKQRNYIEVYVYPILPTGETLQKLKSLKPKSLRHLLPSELARNEFQIAVLALYDPGDEIGRIVLDARLVGGFVEKLETHSESPYNGRLRVSDPLEKVLSVAFEAYRTRYQPLQTTQSTVGF